MSSFRVRHADAADAGAVTRLIRRYDTALKGESPFSESDLADEWRRLRPERDAWVVLDGEDVVGYGTVDEHGNPSTDGYVDPHHVGRGVGALLVELLESELRRRGAATVHTATLAADERALQLFRAHGYAEVRRFLAMRIELAQEPPPPLLPEGCVLETLDPADAEAFHAAYEEAFADHWGHVRRPFEEWRAEHMEGPQYAPELWRVLRCGGELAAGAFGVWGGEAPPDVSRLFTRRAWRRRGLAEALLQDAFALFWRGGRRTVGLGVDATSSTGAQRLYERAGMHVHWTTVVLEKALR
jgi:GNAT superfamily N-acetyltransferase